MANNLPAVTAKMMQDAGAAVATVAKEFVTLQQRAQAENAMVISFERANLMIQLDEVFRRPEVAAVVIKMANEWGWIEVAHDEKKNVFVPDEKILRVSKQAVSMGLLLGDPAGAHFCVMGGRSSMPHVKEAGFRHKLKQAGATNVRLQVAVIGVEPRPNNAQQHDMLICGHAVCTYNGKEYRVERPRETPFRMQSWPSDGPDKNEGLARRRLLRDLWTAVSGESIEEEEPETPQQIAEQNTTELPRAEGVGTVKWHRGIYDGTKARLLEWIGGIPQPDVKQSYELVLDSIHNGNDATGLRERWESEMKTLLRNLGCKKAIGDQFHKLLEARCGELETTA